MKCITKYNLRNYKYELNPGFIVLHVVHYLTGQHFHKTGRHREHKNGQESFTTAHTHRRDLVQH